MQSNQTRGRFPLDPLAFPAETDMRVLLLLVAVAGTTFALVDFTAYVLAPYITSDRSYDGAISAGCALLVLAIVFWLAHWRAQRAAHRQIEAEQWVSFPPTTSDALERASLEDMRAHIEQVIAQLPTVAATRPQLYWNATSRDHQYPSGMAFGYRRRLYICLYQGLHAAFLRLRRSGQFHAVLLHELGHIANRDLSRTTFSIELGRSFTQVALVMAACSEGYLLFHLLRRSWSGTAAADDTRGPALMLQIAVGTAVVVVLIDAIRASILRAREYDADTRARQWLGEAAPLIEVFGTPAKTSDAAPMAAPASLGLINQPAGQRLGLHEWLRTRLVPLHPSHEQRRTRLTDPRQLFVIDLWVTFAAALLGGLALSVNSLLLAALLRFANAIMNQLSSSLTEQLSAGAARTIFALYILVSVLTVLLSIGLFIALFLAPLVGTIGVMVQRAAFADRSLPSADGALLSLGRLAQIALLIGLGIVLGGNLAPASGVLALQGRDWVLAPLFVLMWAAAAVVWLLPLRWLAQRVYGSYIGSWPPVFRRRCLAMLSTLAVTPVFLLTMFTQGAIASSGAAVATPANVVSVLVIIWLLSMPAACVVWGIGALIMRGAGWFAAPSCPGCKATARAGAAVSFHCGECGHALRGWALTPAPIAIPAPPAPQAPPSEAGPPPL